MIGERIALTRFTANVDDLIKGIQAGKKETEDLDKATKGVASTYERLSKGIADAWKKSTDALQVAQSKLASLSGLIDSTLGAIDDQSKRLALSAAAGSVNLDAMSRAAGGLITKQQQLEITATLNHAAFKLTGEQMLIVEQAMRQLTREGNNQEEVIKKVTDAVVKLEGDGLKDFGIQVDSTKTKAEAFTEIMDKLSGKANLVGDGTKTAAEELKSMGVSTSDAFDKVKDATGRLVVALAPLVEKLAQAVGYVADIAAKVPQDAKEGPGAFIGSFVGIGAAGALTDRLGKTGALRSDNLQHDVLQAAFGQSAADDINGAYTYVGQSGQQSFGGSSYGAPQAEIYKAPATSTAKPAKKAGSGGAIAAGEMDWQAKLNLAVYGYLTSAADEVIAGIASSQIADAADQGSAENVLAALNEKLGINQFDENKQNVVDWDAVNQHLDDVHARVEQITKVSGPTLAEKLFGKRSELDGYHEAWGALTAVASAGYHAMVTGSESASAAAKHAAADEIEAIGKRMLVKGAEATAEGNIPEAVAFFAGAALAGVVAHELGGGGGGTSTTGGGGYAATPVGAVTSNSIGASNGGPIVIVAGNEDANDTPRMKQQRAQRYVAKALGQAGYGVEYK